MTKRSEGPVRALLPLIIAVGTVAGLQAQPLPLTGQAPRGETAELNDPEVVRLERFVTTGSAIPTAESETFSPTSVLTAPEIGRWGAATPVEALRRLPSFMGAVLTEQRTNGGNGAANVNLRGLDGAMTLLDGRRTAHDNFHAFPSIAIDRIEVVKDGAAALYGSDALAGVFNVKLVERFDGAKLDLYYGNTTRNDAGVLRAGALVGHTIRNTNLVVGLQTYRRNALYSIDREPSDQADQRARGGLNGGSPAFSGRATARVGSAGNPVEDLVLRPGLTVGLTAADFMPFDTNLSTSNQMLNFRQLTVSIPEQKRESLFGRVNQTWFRGRIETYARLLYSRDRFYNSLPPAPMPTTGTAGTALRNAIRLSPHIPTGFFIADNAVSVPGSITNGSVPFRTTALGSRTQFSDRDVWDFLGGVKGQLAGDWSWHLDYVYSTFYRHYTQAGAPSRSALTRHIETGAYNPWALDSARGTGPTGVPFDNPAALRDSAASGKIDLEERKRGGTAGVTGSLLDLPDGPLKIAAGGDYYRTDRSSVAEPILNSGDLLGLSSSNPSFSRGHGTGVYVQAQVPLISPARGLRYARSVKLDLQGRHDWQTVEGYANGASGPELTRDFEVTNPKLGLQWQPSAEALVRGAWATGFRLPALNQLFANTSSSQPSLRDPLGFPIANQTPTTTRGNPELDPEESETRSAGIVLTLKSLQGLTVAVDYYHSRVDGLVGEGAQFILDTNARTQGPGFVPGNPATLNPNAVYADRITRSGTGTVTAVNSTNFNMATREATGVEMSLQYLWPWRPASGRLTTSFAWNHTLTWDLVPYEGVAAQNFAGTYIDTSTNGVSPGSIPRDKGYVAQQWTTGQWTVGATFNYVGKLRDNPAFTQGGGFRFIEAWMPIDLLLEYRPRGDTGWRRWLKGVTARLGVSNVADEDAPFAAGAFNESYDVTTHSNRGRFVYLQLTRVF